MSDLFDKFVFDLQRFVEISGIGLSSKGWSFSSATGTQYATKLSLANSVLGINPNSPVSDLKMNLALPTGGSGAITTGISSITFTETENVYSFSSTTLTDGIGIYGLYNNKFGLSLADTSGGSISMAFTNVTGAGDSFGVKLENKSWEVTSMTLNSGTLAVTGSGLGENSKFSTTMNTKQLAVGTPFKYDATENSITFTKGGSAYIEDYGDATKLFAYKGTSFQTINTDEYAVLNYTGKAYFNTSESGPTGFNFGGKSDALALTDGAAALTNFTYGTNGGSSFYTGFSLSSITSNASKTLEYLGGTSFVLSGLSADDTAQISSTKSAQFKDQGGSIAFTANDGDITAATLVSGGNLTLYGDTTLKINGGEIDITGLSKLTYTFTGGKSTIDLGTEWKENSNIVFTKAEKVNNIALSGITNLDNTGAKFGDFTFGGNDQDGKVWLIIDGSGSIAGISGLDTGAWVQATTLAGLSINGASVSIASGGDNLKLWGAGDGKGLSSITGLAAGAVVNEAGSATKVVADGAGIGTFTFGTSGIFEIKGETTGSISNFFTLDANVKVTGISGIEAIEYIVGSFSTPGDITINGQGLSIANGTTGTDNIWVYGNNGASAIGSISNILGGAKIYQVGGASKLITNGEGSFQFLGTTPIQSFSVAGDTQINFIMNVNGVSGITGFNATDGVAVLQGSISNISINDKTMSLTGVSYADLKYMINAAEVATLAGVSAFGDTGIINNAAGASVIGISGAGEYKFFSAGTSYTVGLSVASYTDANGIFMQFNSSGLSAVSSFDQGAQLTGDFSKNVVTFAGTSVTEGTKLQITGDSSVMIENDDVVIKNLSNGATLKTVVNITEAWTDSLGSNSALGITDAKERNYTLSVAAAGGASVKFILDGSVGYIVGAESLGANVSLMGGLSYLTSVNGTSFVVTGDNDTLGVVGKASFAGISGIFGLGGTNVVVSKTGGASWALTDNTGSFTFGSGSAFTVAGDNVVKFSLDSTSAVTAITGLSAEGSIETYAGVFAAGLSTVNGQSIAISGDAGTLKLFGYGDADSANNTQLSKITGLGNASEAVVISAAGSATTLETDAYGTFQFGTTGLSYTTNGTGTFASAGKSIWFEVDQNVNVTGISALDATEYIVGSFSTAIDLTINGQSGLQIVNGGNAPISVYGNASESGVGIIAGLSGDATIYGAASATELKTINDGIFNFSTAGQSFTVTSDTNISFIMDTNAAASVAGISYFGDVASTLEGSLSGIYINSTTNTIDVTGDKDKLFSYMADGAENYTLGSVSGTNVVINGTGGASTVQITGDGSYKFFSASAFNVGLSGDTDGLFFVINSSNSVAQINSFDKGDTVSGDFKNAVIFNSGTTSAATVSVTDSDNNISVIYDDIIIKNLTNAQFNTLRGVAEAWTDIGNDSASSFIVTDEDGHSFTVTGTDADGVQFLVNTETGHIYGVSSLDEGVTLEGSLNALSSINGVNFDIKGDSSFGVIGGTAGISTVFNLGSESGVTINNAGGASWAITDKEGTFTFGDSSVFTIGADSEVTFLLTGAEKAVASGVSYLGVSDAGTGYISAEASVFESFTVNGKTVQIENDANELTIFGNDTEDGIGSISNVGPSSASITVNVINAGGASQIITDQIGGFSFADSGQLFGLGGDSEITFGLSNGVVESIDKFGGEGASAVVFGTLNDVSINDGSAINVSVNGVGGNSTMLYYSIADDNKTTFLGTSSTVPADAVVSIVNAGGASFFDTSNTGSFSFADNTAPFTVAGDDNILFQLDSSSAAKAIGVNYLGVDPTTGGGVSATITGHLNDLTAGINGSTSGIVIDGDSNNEFSFMVDNTGTLASLATGEHATLGGVSGANVSIDAIAGASTVQITGGGSYTFGVFDLGTYGLSGDTNNSVFFTKDSIVDLDKDATVTGSFSTAGFSVNSKGIQVTGDNNIGLIGGASAQSVERIFNLSPSSTVVQADGVSYAYSDDAADGVYKFANGTLSIAGDSTGVTFLLDGKAGVIGISGLDADATLTGSLSVLTSINGTSFSVVEIGGDNTFGVVGSDSGIGAIFGVGGTSVYVNNAGGASKIYTDDEGTFYFKQDGASATVGITLGTDSTYAEAEPNNAAVFKLDNNKDSYALGVSGLSYESNYAAADHTVFESGFTVNGQSIGITGDKDDLVVYALSGATGIQIIANVGGDSVIISNMGGASFLITDKTGTFTFGESSGTTFTTGGDSYIGFMTSGGTSVVEIGGIGASGWVESDKLNNLTINNVEFDIQNDEGTMQVYGKGDLDVWDNEDGDWEEEFGNGITKIAKVGNASGSAVIVNYAGGATTIETDQNGSFYFASGQSFILTSTSGAVTEFIMDASHSASVTGIEAFEDGTIQFNTVVTALSVNTLNVPGQNMTFTNNLNDIVLTIDPYTVVGAGTINGGISGMVDGTVIAEGPVTVNGMYIDITEADEGETYGVIVKDSEAIGANSVTGDATVNVASFSVAADKDGTFLIGKEEFEFSDENGFNFTTGGESQLTGVTNLDGYMVDEDGDISVSINGDDITVDNFSDTPVTLRGDGSHLTAVEGITDGSTVTGALDNAMVSIPADTLTGTAIDEAVDVTINGNQYALYDDDDGILVIGADNSGIGRILDLNDEASVKVAKAGTYLVNTDPATLTAQAGDIIIGDDNRTTAYIYDPNNILVRPKTPLHEIERITGLTDDRTLTQVGGPSGMGTSDKDHYGTDTPLTKADTDFIFGISSASTAHVPTKPDLDLPLAIYIDNTVTGTQVVDLSGYDYPKVVHMYNGSQSVIFNPVEGGNLAHVESVGSGQKDITLGNGGDVVVVDQKAAIGNKTNIVGGAGADSVFVRASGDVVFDMSKGGADKVVTFADANARVTLESYQASLGGGVKIDELADENIADAIENDYITFGDGVVSINSPRGNGNHSEVDVGQTVGGSFVNLFNHKNEKQAVGFTSSEGGVLDGSSASDPLILIGNKDGKKSGGSTMSGGSGPDTIFGGADDSINARGGNNTINMHDDSSRGGATIAITEGQVTINNMNNSLVESTGDTLEVGVKGVNSFTYDGSDLVIDGDGFYAVVEGADQSSLGNYTTQYIKNTDNDTVYKVAIGAEDATMYVTEDEDVRPNAFYGNNGAVSFENYTGTAAVDLKGDLMDPSLIDDAPAFFDGVNKLIGGEGEMVFKGSDANETLVAGSGMTSLYGDGGKNVLSGYPYESSPVGTKEGYTTFFVLGNADGAANTITNFEFVSDDNYKDTSKVTADRIEVQTDNNFIRYVNLSGNDLYFEVADKAQPEVSESVVIKGAYDSVTGYGKDVRIENGVSQVGRDKVLVDRFADFYMATEKNATVYVASDLDSVNIWLEDPDTGKNFEGDFAVIDATGSDAKAELSGNGKDNTIIAGTGDTSLWGGGNGDDYLVGGIGKDSFFYNLGNGNDTFVAGEGDEVILGDMTISDIISADASDSDKVVFTLSDGARLTVNEYGTSVDFKVANNDGGQDTYYLNSNRELTKR